MQARDRLFLENTYNSLSDINSVRLKGEPTVDKKLSFYDSTFDCILGVRLVRGDEHYVFFQRTPTDLTGAHEFKIAALASHDVRAIKYVRESLDAIGVAQAAMPRVINALTREAQRIVSIMTGKQKYQPP